MVSQMKRFLVGQPIATEQQHHERLSRTTALAVFSSDALSSVAYATEAILGVLILAGSAALGMVVPIAVAIAALLLMVAFSYRQTIHAYPRGGVGYIVSRENLGVTPGLIAAAALLIDYVLTVAVSISAGVAAITSLAGNWGLPGLADYAVEVALFCIMLISLANLRGIKESGAIFSAPTYLFVFSMLSMIGIGIAHIILGGGLGPVEQPVPLEFHTQEAIGIWLVLRAFAAGCTALTGIEAISDGVPAFKAPESKNAAATLLMMAGLLTTMFLGITFLANYVGAVPNEVTHETIVSQVARTIFGDGPVYGLIQIATAIILVLAANTAYADFPRLSSFLSRDRFLPRQFSSRGDRLVFSNGILALGFFAALLVIFFQANEIAMLPLYAIGVFISFTLSQAGMVIYQLRYRIAGWRRGILISGAGTLLTAIVLVVLAVTKFTHGAWAVLLLIPLLVAVFKVIQRHYVNVAAQLSLTDAAKPAALRRHTAIVLVSGVHKGTLPALRYAQAIAPDNVTAVYVDLDADATEKLRIRWEEWGCDIPLVVLASPYRSLLTPLLTYIEEMEGRYRDDMVTIVLPEFVPAHWWEYVLHNQTGLLIKSALMLRKGSIVTSVPYHLER